MRLRFFLAILAVLVVVSIGLVLLHTSFLNRERMASIDQQVRETASALVDSELGDLRKIDFDRADEIISDELGENRIGKFFVIRNSHGDKVFESSGAKLLGIGDIPQEEQWISLKIKNRFVRVLNLQLPRIPDRTLQVGLVIDKELLASNLSSSAVTFISVALALGLLASFFLTSFLLKPIVTLAGHLTQMSKDSFANSMLPHVPQLIAKNPFGIHDEFDNLVKELNLLVDKVNRNYTFSRLWAYQMAHELKTPLAILTLEAERIQKTPNIEDGMIKSLLFEGRKMSDTINSFLDWAELENTSRQKYLFANKLGGLMSEVCRRFDNAFPNRVRTNIEADPSVVCATQHLEQLIANLLKNALTYSDGEVNIRITSRSLSIRDHGRGIPDDVVKRLGEPFNRGDTIAPGHGLGLAWVKSICRLYDWELNVDPTPHGTRIDILFDLNTDQQG